MNVRNIREDEIETLVDDLWVPFAAEMADLDSYNEVADEVRESALTYRRDHLADDDVATFVADADGPIAGYAVVVSGDSPPVFARGPEATLEELYVVPAHRGEGIATALMDRAEGWAADRGCDYITLSVNASNDSAAALYESSGYAVRRHKMDKPLE
ncbi:GNAT family N-acetyltransferase [Natrinema salaciae]|uniref:Ribosomal protein S18 acetylase RimI n=1 Tax=Natrinema salaciae TaxID=1186196 RepID=A0A1H9K682_9EURY|nr:GNAT family N-acetyltransferase [Natrinema salaciae]SEQ94661.1 Ribosomal protein S18 acetylase RimI [Natrinema salaciae]